MKRFTVESIKEFLFVHDNEDIIMDSRDLAKLTEERHSNLVTRIRMFVDNVQLGSHIYGPAL